MRAKLDANVLSNPANEVPEMSNGPIMRLDSIDSLRAMAMLMVFTYHAWAIAGTPRLAYSIGPIRLQLGDVIGKLSNGVDLFMVLSGFCLFWPVARSSERMASWNASQYLQRRLRRIVPPYYLAIVYVSLQPHVLVAVFHLLGKAANLQPGFTAWQYFTHVLFIHTLFNSTWDGIQGSFWSLGLEMQFYLAFPFLIWAYRKYGKRTLFGMVCIAFVYRYFAAIATSGLRDFRPYLVTIFFLGRWVQFAAGMGAALVVARIQHSKKLLSGSTGGLLIGGSVVMYAIATSRIMRIELLSRVPLGDLILSVAFGALIVGLCASTNRIKLLFEARLLGWIGYISYSVFLIHQNTLYYLGEFFRRVHPVPEPDRFIILETFGFCVILGIAYAFFLMCEAPFVNDPRRSGRSLTKAPP